MQPYLANSWEVSDDNLTYTFRLRNDVKFHDGTPFNAEAAKFNFELWMDPGNQRGSSANMGEQLARVEAPDEFTLVLTLKEVNVFFADEIATVGVVFGSPAGYALYGDDFTRNPVGTGPYKMGEWKENVSLALVRNDDYQWGPPWANNRGPGFADEYEAFEMPEVASKVAAYASNDLSFMNHYSLVDMQPFFADPAHQIFLALAPGQPWYLQSNSINFPTDDVAVRRALIHATDRGTVTRSVTLGFGALAASLLVPGTVGYNPELENMYPFDIAKANQLLDEAGYARGDDGFRYSSDGRLLEVSFPDTPNPFSQPYKLNIENAIGISVATPNMEWGTAVEQYLQGQHHHKWQGGVGLEGATSLHSVYHSSNFGVPGNRSFTFYKSDEIDRLLDEIRVEPDRDIRWQKTDRVHQIVMEAALGIPLVEWGTIFPSNTNKVGGRQLHQTGVFPLMYDMYSTEE
jgi:peptide/nickel transport system substrate-binding protein